MDLPDEVLDDVLWRVPPRRLAACRRVCRSWRDVIDGRGLVLAHLALGPVRGIFVSFTGMMMHRFFSRAADAAEAPPSIEGSLQFMSNTLADKFPRGSSRVWDHCNGLLLYQNSKGMYVCNPATRRWATLPASPLHPDGPRFYRDRLHLVFDPTVSLHYRVMFFPEVPCKPTPPPRNQHLPGYRLITYVGSHTDYIENLPPSLRASYEQEVEDVASMEWPPYSYALQVFSSETGLWEERCFVRQGEAVTTVSHIWSSPCEPTCGRALRCYAAVYWQGALYLNWPGGFIMRFSLLEDRYTVIRTPRLQDMSFWGPMPLTGRNNMPNVYLAKSKQGIYYTALQGYRLQIWILHGACESSTIPEWELKHQVDLKPSFSRHDIRHHKGEVIGMSWILTPSEGVSNDRVDHMWDSDDDCSIDVAGRIGNHEAMKNRYGIDLMGYHPYKEIIFLRNCSDGFAYYIGSSKLECLGRIYPTFIGGYTLTVNSCIYTPCKDDLLLDQNDQ